MRTSITILIFSLSFCLSWGQTETINDKLRRVKGMPPPEAKVEIDKILKTDSAVYNYLVSEEMIFVHGMIVVLANDAERIDQVYEWLEHDFRNDRFSLRREVELTCFIQRFRCNQAFDDNCIKWCEQMFELDPSFRGSEYFHANANFSYVKSLVVTGQMDKMEESKNRILSVMDRYSKMSPKSEIHLNYALANVYEVNGELLKAKKRLEIAKDIFHKSKMPKRQDWAKLNNNQAVIYELLGEYALATAHFEEALRTIRMAPPAARRTESVLLNNLGYMNARLGNQFLSIAYFNESLSKMDTSLARHLVRPNSIYRNLAGAYASINRFDRALGAIDKSIMLTLEEKPIEWRTIFNSKLIRARILMENTLLNEALEELMSAKQIGDSIQLAYKDRSHLYRLEAELLMKKNEYKHAIFAFEKLLNESRSSNQQLNLVEINAEFDLARALLFAGDSSQSAEVYESAHAKALTYCVNEFQGLTPEEQRQLVLGISPAFVHYNYAATILDRSDLKQAVFNQSLLFKGLILNEQLFLRANNNYFDWQNIIGEYDQSQNVVSSKLDSYKRTFRLDTISKIIQSESTLLYNDWRELQAEMASDHLLIDWCVSSNEIQDDSFLVMVNVLSKNMNQPIAITIGRFAKDEFQQDILLGEDSFSSVGSEFWSPIKVYLERGMEIHMCGAPQLQSLPMVALSEAAGLANTVSQYMSWQDYKSEIEQFDLAQIDNALLVGGLDYSSDSTLAHVDNFEQGSSSLRSMLDSYIDVKWPEIRYTRNEIKTAKDILEKGNIKCSLLSGVNGTERVLSNYLSQSTPNILHIATHGFVLSVLNVHDDYIEMTPEELLWSEILNDPLKRTGLILSGGQYYWNATKPIIPQYDNLLTAREIQKMDLSNTSLVVLSACQTARRAGVNNNVSLGEDGIYGLASSLKLAGAKRLILSLWDVDDRASMEFMVLFYEELMATNSPAQAMKNTRALMKQKYPDPKDWAGWVLIN